MTPTLTTAILIAAAVVIVALLLCVVALKRAVHVQQRRCAQEKKLADHWFSESAKRQRQLDALTASIPVRDERGHFRKRAA